MLRQRIFSAVGMLLALFAAAFLLPPIGVMLLIMALGILGLIEYGRLLRHAGVAVFTKIMLFGGVLLTGVAYLDLSGIGRHPYPFPWEIAALTFCLFLIMMQALRQTPDLKTLTAAAGTVLGLLYLPVLLNFYMRLALIDGLPASGSFVNWRVLALFPIVTVKVSDMGAFFVGRRFGRRKLCPHLSPGKTWAGFGGGIATAVLVSLFFAIVINTPDAVTESFWRPLPLALCGILLAVVGVAGDLCESFLKRVTDVKDSSGVLPGMGGVLDVLDSLLFSAPVFYVILRIAA